MVCKRCGAEFVKSKATDKMLGHSLCINCVMEWHRVGEESLNKFAGKKRESHFKM